MATNPNKNENRQVEVEEEMKAEDTSKVEVKEKAQDLNLGDAVADLKKPMVQRGWEVYNLLLKEPKVGCFIQKDKFDESESKEFILNGVYLTVPKGRIVNVPASLADLIANTVGSR